MGRSMQAQLEEMPLVGEGGCGGARRHVELVEDVAHMARDGFLADHELIANRTIGLAGDDEAQDVELACRKETG